MNEIHVKTLYKKQGKNWRVWTVVVRDNGSYATIVVSHGLEDGAIQKRLTHISEGKNIGKANETAYLQQAISEAESKANKQIDKGYSEDKVEQFKFRPMLAHRFDKNRDKVSEKIIVQSKMDGGRAYFVSKEQKLYSRNGKIKKAMGHLVKQLSDVTRGLDIILDGELYNHSMNFQDLISCIKRDMPNEHSHKVEYWMYDCYVPSQPDLPYAERLKMIRQFAGSQLLVCPSYEINATDVAEYYNKFVSENFEGAMVRNPNSVYKVNGRSYDLLKVKSFLDDEFVIVGGELDADGGCVFECEAKNGKLFRVRPEGSISIRENYYNNIDKLKGKLLTVRYFEETKDGIPRFPVGVTVRDYE